MGRKLTDAERELRAMTEAQFQRRVQYRAKKHGWRCFHVFPSLVGGPDGTIVTATTKDGKGFPDLLLVRAGRAPIYAELKRELGTVSPEQWAWLELLIDAGQIAVVWRPSDLPKIEEVLK
jgi:hypothetical protein